MSISTPLEYPAASTPMDDCGEDADLPPFLPPFLPKAIPTPSPVPMLDLAPCDSGQSRNAKRKRSCSSELTALLALVGDASKEAQQTGKVLYLDVFCTQCRKRHAWTEAEVRKGRAARGGEGLRCSCKRPSIEVVRVQQQDSQPVQKHLVTEDDVKAALLPENALMPYFAKARYFMDGSQDSDVHASRASKRACKINYRVAGVDFVTR